MMCASFIRLLATVVAATVCLPAIADDTTASDKLFLTEVRPLLAEKCFECHGPDVQEGDLRLDFREGAVRELDSGNRAIVPGDAGDSELIHRIASDDPDQRMPPDGQPLSSQQIESFKKWIADSAPYVKHWAYAAIDATVPEVKDKSWVANPIDCFVLSRLESLGIAPSPQADRYTLVKRLHYDLIGLPPSPELVDRFVSDTSPDAYRILVDSLLDSPHFGERWGRHWLDKARYADSDGYEKDKPRLQAWRYRDWVVDAVNDDMPIDQFTIQQLAGDLLPDATDRQRLATAFHRQTLTNTEGGVDQEQFRVDAVFDRTETTGAVWLGLTIGCARCHSHKYDAISQEEYYRLFAFFNNGEETNLKWPTSDSQSDVQVRVLSSRSPRRDTKMFERGDFLSPKQSVAAGGLSVLPVISGRNQQNLDRLDLARWLTDPSNPLTPRVLANHVWSHLFGEGLVRTMNDFGVRGQPPSHPRLLDWLGQQYRRLGWSRKRLIRSIVLSSSYRQASFHRPELLDVDPQNLLLARQNRFRVSAEVVRDVCLSASGLLSEKVGGPSVFPPLPADVAALSYANNFKWKTSGGEDRYRRGMYTFFKRTAPHPNLVAFDCPDSNTTAVGRRISNTPLQALTILNNEVYVEAAQALAMRMMATDQEEAESADRHRIERLLRLCVARPPTDFEVRRFQSLLDRSRAWYARNNDAAKQLALRHRRAEIGPGEAAAWIAVARVALNLDELITRE